MPLPANIELIAGAQELYDWFGYWPDFHDAEIIKFHLELGVPSSLVIHTWQMTNRVNAQGYYELTKHVIVEFVLDGISTLNLQDPWARSILLDLVIEKDESGFRLILWSAYGLSGIIEAHRVSLQITHGQPSPTSPSS